MATHRIESVKWLAPMAVLGALGLAACSGGDPSDTVETSSGNRAALLAEAERYVDQQKVPLAGPLYTVEVHGFKALDESGSDWSGSDEVFGLFHSTRGYSTRTTKQGNVDSGDFRRIGNRERCLAPQRILSGGPVLGWLVASETSWDCGPSTTGVAAPIGLTLELWEDDPCSAFVPPVCFNPFAPPVRDPKDDLIGRHEVTYTSAQLESRLREVGDVIVDHFILGGPCGHTDNPVCSVGPFSSTGPEYKLTINIRLVRDAPVLTPVGQHRLNDDRLE
jgi:hypothetical protein